MGIVWRICRARIVVTSLASVDQPSGRHNTKPPGKLPRDAGGVPSSQQSHPEGELREPEGSGRAEAPQASTQSRGGACPLPGGGRKSRVTATKPLGDPSPTQGGHTGCLAASRGPPLRGCAPRTSLPLNSKTWSGVTPRSTRKIAQGKELPAATDLFEQVAVELEQGPRHSVDLGVVKRRKLSDLLGTLPANRPFPGKEAVREEVGKALGRPSAPLT